MTTKAIEAGARAAARIQGDDFDKIPRDKPHWTAERGHFNGRFRDINEPFQSGYLEISEAAIEAAIASGELVPASAVAAINRDELVKLIWDLSSVNLTPEVAKRQANRIADGVLRALEPASGEFVLVPAIERLREIAYRDEAKSVTVRADDLRAMLTAATSNGSGK
jgi:hypothetical protein